MRWPNQNTIFFILIFALFNHNLYCPDGLKPPVVKGQEWEEVMIGYDYKKELSVKVDGNRVICNNRLVDHGPDEIHTVVTIGDQLYINGKLIDRSQFRKRIAAKKKLAAAAKAVPAQRSLNWCVIL